MSISIRKSRCSSDIVPILRTYMFERLKTQCDFLEHRGEISGESVGKMLRKSKSRIVKRVLSGGKFGVSELETLAKIRDSDNR